LLVSFAKALLFGSKCAESVLSTLKNQAMPIGAHTCYIYIRGEFYQEAIEQAYEVGFLRENVCGIEYSFSDKSRSFH